MKAKYIFLLTLGLLFSGFAQAQQAELNATPPAQPENIGKTVVEEEANTNALNATPPSLPRKVQYTLSAGSMFARGLGAATYFRPGIMLPVSNRFSIFGSLSVINNFSGGFNQFAQETGQARTTNFAATNYILNVGGNYLVNERLNLSGSVWRDLSNQNYLPNAPINVFGANGTSGMQFRAHYKITENLSVSGGLRFSNGNRYNSFYQQDFMPGGF